MIHKATILHYRFGKYGGAELYTLQAAKALVAAGCEVNAISTMLTKRNNEVDGIAHRGLLIPSKLQRIIRRGLRLVFGSDNNSLKVALEQSAQKSDLIVVGHFHLLTPAIEYAQIEKKKVWLIVYGIDIWRKWTEEEILALKACDCIIALSSFTANNVGSRLPAKSECIEVIHPMVDTKVFSPGLEPLPDQPRIILTVSRLDAYEAYKGHDLIIKALPLLRAELKVPVEYHIIGDGSDRRRLEKLAQETGSSQMVRFLGQMWSNEIIDAYRQCHVFAMPSYVSERSDGSWTGEGFGIVYIEAGACAKPVLACDEGGQTDAVQNGQTGVLVKPTVESVAAGLIKMLKNLEVAREMGSAGRQFVLNNFTKEKFEHKWAKLLQ